MTPLYQNPVGKAYGFFYSNASKQEIVAELPKIRGMVNTPSELEISIVEGIENAKGDRKLRTLAREYKQNEERNYGN